MNSTKKIFLLSILVFAIAIINLISRKQFSFAYTQILPYNQFYYLDEQLRIYDIQEKDGDSLIIKFKGGGIKGINFFEVFTDSTLFLSQEAENLTIKPDQKQKKYILRINGQARRFLINIDYTPLSVYRQAGNSSTAKFEVTSQDLLLSSAAMHKLSDWDITSFWKKGISDKSEVDSYLRDSMKVLEADSTHIKVLKIAQYLLDVTKGRLGIPSDYLAQLSPIQQLEYIRSGRSQLWCGNYVDFFSFFSSFAGVSGRLVSCGNNLNNTASANMLLMKFFCLNGIAGRMLT